MPTPGHLWSQCHYTKPQTVSLPWSQRSPTYSTVPATLTQFCYYHSTRTTITVPPLHKQSRFRNQSVTSIHPLMSPLYTQCPFKAQCYDAVYLFHITSPIQCDSYTHSRPTLCIITLRPLYTHNLLYTESVIPTNTVSPPLLTTALADQSITYQRKTVLNWRLSGEQD